MIGIVLSGCGSERGAFFETVDSANDLPTSIQRFRHLLEKRGMNHIATIDHAKNAQDAGVRLKPETVILFGHPKIGAALISCNPSMGLDLPLRMLFTTDYEGNTKLSYTNPEYWSLKHNIKDKRCLGIIKTVHATLRELAEASAQKVRIHQTAEAH